jgi:hypothetical protein
MKRQNCRCNQKRHPPQACKPTSPRFSRSNRVLVTEILLAAVYASQFGFHACYSMTLQCMRLIDHVTLNFNNNTSTAALFLDFEKAFDTTWHPGLLCKLSKLQFSTSLIKLISSFLSQGKFRVSVEGKLYMPRYMQAGVPQGSVLTPTLYNLYINDTPQTSGVNLAVFASDTCLMCDRLQRGLCSEKNPVWAKLYGSLVWTLEDKTRVIYFTHRTRPPGSLLALNGQNIPFVNSINTQV